MAGSAKKVADIQKQRKPTDGEPELPTDPEVVSASLSDLPPALPSKSDGGGIFLSRQTRESSAPGILCMSGGDLYDFKRANRNSLNCLSWRRGTFRNGTCSDRTPNNQTAKVHSSN